MIAFDKLQSIGKALMLPVAVLPAAAILTRFGAADVLDIEFFQHAGQAVFDNLPIIFSIGIAFGMTEDKRDNGAAALAGFVFYAVMVAALKSIDPEINMGIFAGIVSGLTTSFLYNRFYNIKVPEILGFFGGRRFVPIISSLVAIVMAGIFGLIWPPVQSAIELLGQAIVSAGGFGAFIYGVLNRILLPFGLHHILNNLVWFVFGDYTNPVTGAVVHGDLSRFFAGDPTAGGFMSGGFPVMMFGLPAVALAMYRTAKPENRPKIKGALISMALTSFLTGITEPIEFSFMFLAPVLYVVHAFLFGVSMFVCYEAGVLIGCSFSMGFVDYVINWGLATNPELIIPIGIVFGLLYYVVFTQVITYFDLPTLGRYEDNIAEDTASDAEIAETIVKSLGGAENIAMLDNCVTRLRLTVKDPALFDENTLKSLGAVKGVMQKDTAIQVIIGFRAESVANEINFMTARH